jgi:hypothetical protein
MSQPVVKHFCNEVGFFLWKNELFAVYLLMLMPRDLVAFIRTLEERHGINLSSGKGGGPSGCWTWDY